MDRRLINEEEKRIGRVKDLVINRKNNKIEKIIISSMYILGEDVPENMKRVFKTALEMPVERHQ
jgi:sporulation protein YlmC with PRC-barrel domain